MATTIIVLINWDVHNFFCTAYKFTCGLYFVEGVFILPKKIDFIEIFGVILAISSIILVTCVEIYRCKPKIEYTKFNKIINTRQVDENDYLRNYVNNSKKMYGDAVLKSIYRDIACNMSYKNDYPELNLSDDNFIRDSFVNSIQTGHGKCYSYAIMFTLCAKELGENAKLCTGTLQRDDGEIVSHAWCMIDNKIYDACFDSTDMYSDKTYEYYGVTFDRYTQNGQVLTLKNTYDINF